MEKQYLTIDSFKAAPIGTVWIWFTNNDGLLKISEETGQLLASSTEKNLKEIEDETKDQDWWYRQMRLLDEDDLKLSDVQRVLQNITEPYLKPPYSTIVKRACKVCQRLS